MAPLRHPAPQAAPTGPYRTLDGLRGVAALIVVTRHVGEVAPPDLFPESFLAVDLFFLLSGFVVAFAYERRLVEDGGRGWFLRTRLIRLYPLYILGIALGALAYIAAWLGAGQPVRMRGLSEALVIGALMLPNCPPLPMGSSTLDGPTWTLLPEILVNLLYARLARWLNVRALLAIVAAGAVGLVISERVYGTLDGGWWWKTFPLIGARLAFSFFAGVLLYRWRPQRRRSAWAAWAALAVLALALIARPPDAWRASYELLAVLVVFPLVVAAAVRWEPGARSAPVFATLGAASYAVYVLHQPLGVLAGEALRRAVGHPLSAALGFSLFLPLATLTALLADRYYDEPARRWLKGLAARPLKTLRRAQA